jgi:RsiW-degrading membrane proteinase PrsW (M82 family)
METGGTLVMVIYLAAAILPAVFLLRYIYKKDTIEKEPAGLLISLLVMGLCAAAVSIVLESLGENVLARVVSKDSPVYTLILAFVVVAAVEEGSKLFFLKLRTWRNPNFNYRFDGVVYAVFVSLGFAAIENVGYVLGYGLGVAVSRALLAIPGHMGFAVFMGSFYGRAKVCEAYGDTRGKKLNLWLGYLMAVVLHGFYDTCAMLGTSAASMVFLAFVGIMYGVVIRRIRSETMSDRPI